MMRGATPVREFFRAFPFGVLLLALLLMIVGAPISADLAKSLAGIRGPSGLAPFTILLTVTSAYAVWHLARSRALVIVAAGVILAFLGLSSVELSRLGLGKYISRETLDVFHVGSQSLFLVYVTLSILRTVFRARVVDGNILCGAACVYLLVGVLWGYGYTMLEIIVPASFHAMEPSTNNAINLYNQPGWLVYFSFTTLTTVGFGDVLPAKAFARSLSVLEAVIGQIMIVVMMARLVGLHVAHSTSGPHARFSTDEES
jgi:hypothetical protein